MTLLHFDNLIRQNSSETIKREVKDHTKLDNKPEKCLKMSKINWVLDECFGRKQQKMRWKKNSQKRK